MTSSDIHPQGRGHREADIPAYLQDELAPAERSAFEKHLAACPSCTAETAKYRNLLARLAAPLPEIPPRDLAPEVLARIAKPERLRWPSFAPVILRAAAILLCLVLAGVVLSRLRPAPAASPTPRDRCVGAALGWLHESQEPQGNWDAEKWGAQQNYTPGITALAVLAFLRQEPDALQGAHADVVRRGLDYLLKQQTAEGRFGILCSGTPYNQGLATLALLKAGRLRNDPRWTEAAGRALAYIRSTQLESGGWGYPRTAGDSGNTSITAWQLQALLEAEAAGGHDVRPCIEKGLAWIGKMMAAEGRVGYTRPGDFPNGHLTLTAAATVCLLQDPKADARSEQLSRVIRALCLDAGQETGVDYYRYYFLAQALRAAKSDVTGPVVSRLQESLLACQTRDGAAAGSCTATDPWTAAGGRVYATAMAVLAM